MIACAFLVLGGLFVTQCYRRNQQPEEEEEIRETDLLTLKVMRVIDGDTFEVFYDDEPTSVRIHGIDAPEKAEIGGRESTEALRRILGNSEVSLVFPEARKRDSFGRLLAIVYVNDTNVGEWLINNGFAREYRP